MSRKGDFKGREDLFNTDRDIIVTRNPIPNSGLDAAKRYIVENANTDEIAGLWEEFKREKIAALSKIDEKQKTQIATAKKILMGINIVELRILQNKPVKEVQDAMRAKYTGKFIKFTMQEHLKRARKSFIYFCESEIRSHS